ncbi:MAG: DUF4116 domain-containing protein [Candidatus Pacearchaeota archaeon]|jgi:hypothetical protein
MKKLTQAEIEEKLKNDDKDWRILDLSGTETQHADKEIALAAVKQDGLMLRYASAELRADKEVVLAAVKQNGLALRYASDDLQKIVKDEYNL